jgi:uncharacterized protein
MPRIRNLVVAAFILFAVGPASAADAPPSEDSIRELMRLTDLRKSLDAVAQNIKSSTEVSMRHAFGGQALSEKQEKVLNEMSAQLDAMLKEELGADALEPMYVEIYRKALTQQEVDGMIAFYKTDAGRAVVAKMPTVAKQTMEVTLRRMQTLTPRVQQLQRETLERMKEPQ